MSFRERSAWASLCSTLAVYGVYFAILVPRLMASGGGAPHYLGLLVGCVVLLIVLEVALHTALGIAMRDQAGLAMDERERFIMLKSDRIALAVLTTLLATGWLGVLAGSGMLAERAIVANGLLFALVAASVTKYASQIAYFHRGAA